MKKLLIISAVVIAIGVVLYLIFKKQSDSFVDTTGTTGEGNQVAPDDNLLFDFVPNTGKYDTIRTDLNDLNIDLSTIGNGSKIEVKSPPTPLKEDSDFNRYKSMLNDVINAVTEYKFPLSMRLVTDRYKLLDEVKNIPAYRNFTVTLKNDMTVTQAFKDKLTKFLEDVLINTVLNVRTIANNLRIALATQYIKRRMPTGLFSLLN